MRDAQLIYMLPAALTLLTGLFLAVVSLVKGRLRADTLLFSLICLLWSLNAAFNFVQQAVPQDWAVGMARLHHALLVWLPLAHLHFAYRWLDLRNAAVERQALAVTLVLFLASLTPWYVRGVHTYPWGVAPDVGPLFYVTLVFCCAMMVYLLRLSMRRMAYCLGVEERRPLYVVSASLAGAALLALLDLFPFSGTPLCTPGSFIFLPMMGLAYAVFRYHIFHVGPLLHLTLVWAAASSLILVPNLVLLYWLLPSFGTINPVALFLFFFSWFYLNYRYLGTIQPVIDRVFSRQRFDLNPTAAERG